MKKLVLFICLFMSLSLTACGSDKQEVNNDNNKQDEVAVNQDNKEDDGYERDEDGVVHLSAEQTDQFVSVVEITLDHDWTIHCADYECVAAVGKLIYLNIPDELWTLTDDGKEIIYLTEKDTYWGFPLEKGNMDGYIRDSYTNFITIE